MAIEVTDAEFRHAIELIDAGDVDALQAWLYTHPRLLVDTVPVAEDNAGGYFANPKLLWFVAENPIRNNSLPAKIAAIAETIVVAAEKHGAAELKDDLDYTLGLVASGRVAREAGAQASLIEVLTDRGADPDGAVTTALGHGEIVAAQCLLRCGAQMSLPLAAGLCRMDDVERLAAQAGKDALQAALSVAAINAEAEAVEALIRHGADPKTFNPPGLHAHSTPLHQAIAVGSLTTVKVLVEAGASLEARDTVVGRDALGWARHFGHDEIVEYLAGL